MLDMEQRQHSKLQIVNPTSKRVYASQPYFLSTQNDDIKSHEFFMELSKNRRNLCRIKKINENFLSIETLFSNISKSIIDTQNQMTKLESLHNKIIENTTYKENLNSFLLFSIERKIRDLESKNYLFEDDVKHLKDTINSFEKSKRLENKVKSMLEQENASYKCKLIQIKAKNSKINSEHLQKCQILEQHNINFDSFSKQKEKQEISYNNIKFSLARYEKEIIDRKKEILCLGNEYFIKKRVSLKLIKESLMFSSRNTKYSVENQKILFEQELKRIKSQIITKQAQSEQIEFEISQIHSEYIHIISHDLNLEQKKEELISMNKFLSEIKIKMENDVLKKDEEIRELITLIDKEKEKNENFISCNEELEKNIFDQQIATNERVQQYDQCIEYYLNDINNIKSEISIKKNKNKQKNKKSKIFNLQ